MKTLDEFIATVTADSEADLINLLLNPTTENEMGPVYEQTLGYNPITHFSEKKVSDLLDRIIPLAPNKAGQVLVDKKDEIIELAINNFGVAKDAYLQASLELAIRDFVSEDLWDDDEMEAAFDKDMFGKYTGDDDEEDEMSLDEEDSDDDEEDEDEDDYFASYDED